MTTLKHITEVAHQQQLYIFIAARLVSNNHKAAGAIINGHLFGQHLRLPWDLRDLAPVALRLLLPCCGTINLIDNLSTSKEKTLVGCCWFLPLDSFDSFIACSCHMHNISFPLLLFQLFFPISNYVNFDKWCPDIPQRCDADDECVELGFFLWNNLSAA